MLTILYFVGYQFSDIGLEKNLYCNLNINHICINMWSDFLFFTGETLYIVDFYLKI